MQNIYSSTTTSAGNFCLCHTSACKKSDTQIFESSVTYTKLPFNLSSQSALAKGSKEVKCLNCFFMYVL